MSLSQILKPTLSPVPVYQSNFTGKSRWTFPELGYRKRVLKLQNFRGSRFRKRFRVFAGDKEADNQNNGKEPPESLFMKELRRRGMTPTSLLEDSKQSNYGLDDEIKFKEGEIGFSSRNAVSTNVEKSLSNQRERSMALNSEGLEGLVPRGKLLLTIGGTFFLGFWPLILITVAFFSALYFYFGPTFVHDASKMSMSPPQYVDPFALLEDERISQIAQHLN
ncbi:putative Tubulin alpha-6 chain [Quillaja saponaria]|uniref:Tubulin alpha-6 chain n=1 Tax=Quillaja saponaria TaxID=32244 RepID=A0AAD7KUS0_QUISA|nr:putative Tubulin alpha-6 chain [Quillaja saponaria]